MLATIKNSLEAQVIKGVLALPEGVKDIFAGRNEIVRGEKLNLDFATLLGLQKTMRIPSLEEVGQRKGVDAARQEYSRVMKIGTQHSLQQHVQRKDYVVEARALNSKIPARLYQVHSSPSQSLLVYFHGGGFILGDLDGYEPLLKFVAANTNFDVLSVDYRLCPENPYPAGRQDCIAAAEEVLNHRVEHLPKYQQVFVGGDSAGAVMALTTGYHLVERNYTLAGLWLINPGPHVMGMYPSDQEFGEGYGFTHAMRVWFESQYIHSHAPSDDPDISPLMIEDFSKLPNVWLSVGGCDQLRDQNELLANKMRADGVDIDFNIEPGLIHNYLTFFTLVPQAKTATLRACDWLKNQTKG